MDPASVYLQVNRVPELIDRLILRLVEDQPINAKQYLRDQLRAITEERFEGDATSAEVTYPPFITKAPQRPILIAKALSFDMWKKYGTLRTSGGVSLDDCIRGGLEYHLCGDGTKAPTNPPYGVLLGDADAYTLFAELVDSVLGYRLGGVLSGAGGKSFAAPKSELSSAKITSGFQFDEKFVLGAAVKLRRNVASFRYNCSMTRAERRVLSKMLQRVCKSAFEGAPSMVGTFSNAATLATQSFDAATQDLALPASPSTKSYYSHANAEWPDGRGSYISSDNVFFVNILSGEEHVEIATKAVRSADVRDAFERVVQGAQVLADALRKENSQYEWQHSSKYGYLLSNLDYLYGSGVSVHFIVRLPYLAHDALFPDVLARLKLEQAAAPKVTLARQLPVGDVVVISNRCDEKPYMAMEADVVQLVCAGVCKLLELEDILLRGNSIQGKY